jgi:hypothetical protein
MNVVDRERNEQHAAALRRHAADLVTARNALRATAANGHWHSPAGRTFAESLHGTLLLIQSTGDRAALAADALDRHGRCAEHRARELRAVTKLAVPILAVP